jgi:hypothetical protein
VNLSNEGSDYFADKRELDRLEFVKLLNIICDAYQEGGHGPYIIRFHPLWQRALELAEILLRHNNEKPEEYLTEYEKLFRYLREQQEVSNEQPDSNEQSANEQREGGVSTE